MRSAIITGSSFPDAEAWSRILFLFRFTAISNIWNILVLQQQHTQRCYKENLLHTLMFVHNF